ncbi:hypothetical protein FRE64_08030 [Euhalothece natronophila Z-M001]|uniref:Uncharacterized protein n=1 Tax=Euhalothece natronophila Z-M001 TaxID=522448 RepID=A0A5B8NLH7_9CHRO|nr:hypothetical protein [Euhalothece natronophila]QDZ39894.1 hypothetical protein FRE64_08030 [Euhalothece natronophila Z-M001]
MENFIIKMSSKMKVQTLAGVVALLSMPVLYIGGISESVILEVLGFLMLAFAMLTTPTMKLLMKKSQ